MGFERERERAEDWERRCRSLNLLLAFFFLFPSSVSPLFLFPLSKSKATPLLLATFFRVCVFGQLNEQRRERQQRAAEEERRSVVSKKKKKGKKKTLLCFFSPLVPFLCPSRSPFLSGASNVQRCSHTEHFSFSRPPPLPPRRRRQRLRVKKKKRKEKPRAPTTVVEEGSGFHSYSYLFMRFALSSSVPRLRPPLCPLRPVLRARPSYLLVSFSKRRRRDN